MHTFTDRSHRLRWLTGAGVVGVFAVAAVLVLRKDGLGLDRLNPSTDRMAAELIRADARAGLCSAANAVGVGLRGEYFSEPSLHGKAVKVRVDSVVDFDPLMGWQSDFSARPASVRWSGWIKPPLSGSYRFHAEAPNMRVLVARNLVDGGGAAPAEKVELSAGRFYPVEIIVDQITDSPTRVRLEWTAPHGARYVLSRALLHLPTETVAAPNT
jgi:hypothetical protein